jgi:hypothetical protein
MTNVSLCFIVPCLRIPSLRPSHSRRPLKAPTNLCMSRDTVCLVSDKHHWRFSSAVLFSHCSLSSQFGIVSRPSAIIRYPLRLPFLARDIACNCSSYSFAHFECTHVMKTI